VTSRGISSPFSLALPFITISSQQPQQELMSRSAVYGRYISAVRPAAQVNAFTCTWVLRLMIPKGMVSSSDGKHAILRGTAWLYCLPVHCLAGLSVLHVASQQQVIMCAWYVMCAMLEGAGNNEHWLRLCVVLFIAGFGCCQPALLVSIFSGAMEKFTMQCNVY